MHFGHRPIFVFFAALVAALVAIAAACDRASDGEREPVFGVQLHLHGSLSEGAGSMQGHNHAASQLGEAVDVLWWTDHDWRIAAHTHVTGFDFEQGMAAEERVPTPLHVRQWDGREPLPEWAGAHAPGSELAPASLSSSRSGWRRLRVASPARRTKLSISDREARNGSKSLHLGIVGDAAVGRRGAARVDDDGWQRLALAFTADRRRHVASLASDVRVRLSVMPVEASGDARLVVSVLLSQHPPGYRGRLDYRLVAAEQGGGERSVEIETRAAVGGALPLRVASIDVPYEAGRWNDLVFDLSADAKELDLGGIDNSLAELGLAVEARGGGRFAAFVDALEIERVRVGPELFAEEKALAASLSQAGVVNHVGQEVSYGAHLNAYGPAVPLADSETHPYGYTPREAVEWAHAHGGIVSLNHVFGTGNDDIGHNFPETRPAFDARVARLVKLRAHGADLLEVGYRRRGYGLKGFIELWDTLSSSGVFITGVGVSDSHDNFEGWQDGGNNFITWVHAASASQEDLIEGLRRGRAYFGDPMLFDGRLDMETDTGARMGEVVLAAPGPRGITLRAEGLRKGQRVRLIRDGERVQGWPVEGDRFERRHAIEVASASSLRFEVVEAGAPIALSNPIYFVVDPARRVPEARRPRDPGQ